MNVVLYTTGPACSRCRLSAILLKDSGVAFATIDIRTNPQAHHYVTEELGYTEAPVVVVSEVTDDRLPHENPQALSGNPHQDGRRWHWSGFRPDQLNALAQSEASRGELARLHSQR